VHDGLEPQHALALALVIISPDRAELSGVGGVQSR
jgi:hypothetical protein